MIVFNRELVNTVFSFNTSIFSILLAQNNMNINIDINNPRNRLVNSSTNSFRELLVHLSVSFISYVKRIKAQSNNSWVNQVEELNELQRLTLFYTN